jgi:hypothetical protein
MNSGALRTRAVAVVGLVGLAACGDGNVPLQVDESDPISCSIPTSEIFDGGVGRDGIPALTNPETAAPGQDGTEYLVDNDRVVGLMVDGEALAIPLNIFWWHEIVNLDVADRQVAVTHCPLTGSSLAFDRAAVSGAEFGVSGLLYQNNLILYDRNTQQSLWPQMLRGARCGDRTGTELQMVAIIEMSWGGWRSLHPDTRVVTSNTGFDRSYQVYPYGAYDMPENGDLLYPGVVDSRRPPKERVLGIPVGTQGGVALPYGSMADVGSVAAVELAVGGEPVVVFWNESLQGAMAYRPFDGAMSLTFTVEAGQITDDQTGSSWRVDGTALDGPLAGTQLAPVSEAYVAYWFAWAAFHPNTTLWGP